MLKLKPGDILLFEAKYEGISAPIGWLQKAFDGRAGHTEIVYSQVGRTNTVSCLGSNFDGVKFRMQNWNKKNIKIVRVFQKINVVHMQDTINDYHDDLVDSGDSRYAYMGLARATLNAFLDKVTFRLWKKRSFLADKRLPFCSELVGEIYEKYASYKFSRDGDMNIHNDVLTPSDIGSAYNMIVLKDFGEISY